MQIKYVPLLLFRKKKSMNNSIYLVFRG
jgi:hypothetical protein